MAWHPFRNVGLKITALALSALLWFTVGGHEIERRLPVPVSYSSVPAALEMTGDQVDTVNVHVRGPESIVSGLGPGDLRVIVNLNDANPGANLIPLRVDEVIAPLGLEVTQIDPGTVTVTLERSSQRRVVVTPTVSGEPAPGYVVREVTVEPRTVTVVGPESRFSENVWVTTERVSIDGRSATVTQDVSVGVADAQLRVGAPRSVRVTVRIDAAPAAAQ